jgi:hypothetical protein
MWNSCESDDREPAISSVNKDRSNEGEKPHTCKPTGTLSRSSRENTCLWAGSQLDGRATPTVESLREMNDRVLQRLRESVTRVRMIAQEMQSAGHIAGVDPCTGPIICQHPHPLPLTWNPSPSVPIQFCFHPRPLPFTLNPPPPTVTVHQCLISVRNYQDMNMAKQIQHSARHSMYSQSNIFK